MTSITPPRVSPSSCAASISAIIRAAVASENARTGLASTRSWSCGPGTGSSSGASTAPIATTCDTTSTSRACARNAFATVPSATRAAVSRALARSSTGRASSNPNFVMPARSAWPGRGRVSGALRARLSISAGSTGSADMTVSHFGHSVLPIRTAIGPPCVRPCRMPPITSSSSASNAIRGLRPWPSLRRASSAASSLVVISTPATMPSSTATSAGPWDSPAVIQRNTTVILSPGPRRGSRAAHGPRAPRAGRGEPPPATPPAASTGRAAARSGDARAPPASGRPPAHR